EDLIFKTDGEKHLRLTTKGQLEVLNTGNSVFIGENAGSSDDLSDNLNVFIGNDVGKENVSGYANTVIGANAFQNNVDGKENTYVGYESGLENTSGSYNTVFGFRAFKNNLTGQENAIIGRESMASNVDGSLNTTLGEHTLVNGTSHKRSVALGWRAGFGQNSGGASQTGGIFIGTEAGRDIQTGSYNTFIGFWSGIINTTGEENIFLGRYAGGSNTTGSRNIYIGKSSGIHVNGDDNIILGNGIEVPIRTGSNQLNIGSLIFGNNIDGTGTGISTGNIGIGIKSPNAKLDIDGGIKIADDTDTCDSTKIGTLRYNADANNSYVDMCMQTGVSTYAWETIKTKTW
ncbi:MAG: hypothetical protein KAT32_03680, partial [Candidatus Moranbacteria bacterium]|nr:hypothetical protein [Candidatus Moranbacteria bacterium]